MSVSKKAFGVQGFTATKSALTKDALEISKALEYLKHAPFKDGTVKRVLQKGSQPLVDELQQQYLKGDPTGMGGDIGIFIDVVPAKRRLDTVYIGPAKKISKGWQLWYIMNWGHAVKDAAGNVVKIVAGKRFIDKALVISKGDVIKNVGIEFEKELVKYAKKLGFDLKG